MAEARRSRYGVSSEKEASLEGRLAKLGVHEEDLVEKFVRASGPGGQKVNKTSTAVHLKHLPSGIEVKAQTARSQSLNRYHARQRLADKLEEEIEGKKSAAQQQREKIRRQKRRRSRRAKAKMVTNKRIQGEKKRQRGKPTADD